MKHFVAAEASVATPDSQLSNPRPATASGCRNTAALGRQSAPGQQVIPDTETLDAYADIQVALTALSKRVRSGDVVAQLKTVNVTAMANLEKVNPAEHARRRRSLALLTAASVGRRSSKMEKAVNNANERSSRERKGEARFPGPSQIAHAFMALGLGRHPCVR